MSQEKQSNWENWPPESKEEAPWYKVFAFGLGQLFNLIGLVGGTILAAETGIWYLFLLLIPGIPLTLWGGTDGKGGTYSHAGDWDVM